MSPHESSNGYASSSYFISADQHLKIARLVYREGYYALCCYLVATALEMAGGGLLILNGIENSNDAIRKKYGHSVRGIFIQLAKANIIQKAELYAVLTVVEDARLPDPDRGKSHEEDYGANIFKFPYKHIQRGWPNEWVDEEYAETILETAVPVLEKILAQNI